MVELARWQPWRMVMATSTQEIKCSTIGEVKKRRDGAKRPEGKGITYRALCFGDQDT